MTYYHREDLWPRPAEPFHAFDEGSGSMSVLVTMSQDKFNETFNIGVIVESWDHKRYGRVKRAYLAEFTDAERKKIGRYHTKFRRWYLVTGVPKRVAMMPSTIALMHRAINFFAGA